MANIKCNGFDIVSAEKLYKKVIELRPEFDKPYQMIAGINDIIRGDEESRIISVEWARRAYELNSSNIYSEVIIMSNCGCLEEAKDWFEGRIE